MTSLFPCRGGPRLCRVVSSLVALTLAACTKQQWRSQYPAPYNAASSEREARIWKRSDEVFTDRLDWLQQPILKNGEVLYPHSLNRPDLVFPDSLRAQQGEVTVAFLIETDGTVRDVRVLFSTNNRFDETCRNAIRTWRFTPGSAEGKPVILRYSTTCAFRHGATSFVNLQR